MDANGQDNAITTESYRLSSNYQHVYKQDNIVDVTIRSIVRNDPPAGRSINLLWYTGLSGSKKEVKAGYIFTSLFVGSDYHLTVNVTEGPAIMAWTNASQVEWKQNDVTVTTAPSSSAYSYQRTSCRYRIIYMSVIKTKQSKFFPLSVFSRF